MIEILKIVRLDSRMIKNFKKYNKLSILTDELAPN
jgi:hypothetical protein